MLHKILIVENEPEYYFNFKDILVDHGFLVDEFCPTYEDALELIEKNQPDIAVLDIDLDTEKTGIDIGNYLYQNTDIPFIFMTALNDREIFHEALHTHHKSFLVKTDLSTDKEKVVRNILTVLNNHNKNFKQEKNEMIGAIGMKGYVNELKNNTRSDNFEFKRFISFNHIAYFSSDRENFEKFKNLIGVKQNEELKRGYIWFQTNLDNQVFLMKNNLSNILDLLPDNFIQVNQKYIVNTSPEFLQKARNEHNLFVFDREFKIGRHFITDVKNKLKNIYLDS